MCCLLCSLIDFNCLESVFVSAPVHLGCNCIHDVLLSDILSVEWLCLVGILVVSQLQSYDLLLLPFSVIY